ncbi:MAG TPA: DUF58 domain-containing protein [Acidimicrobiales bacterium]
MGVVGIWWLVAHNGGAGWVQFVGDLVFGALIVGVVGPGVVVSRARIQVCQAPPDGVTGLPVEVRVVASGRMRVRPIDPAGEETLLRRSRSGSGSQTLRIVPPRRGVYRELTLDVASGAPFALQWWHRRVTVELPQDLLVAPRRGRSDPPRPRRLEQADHILVQPRSDTGFPRGARPYVAGDPRHRVHWHATAHTGSLMVKELEHSAGGPVTVVVELPADADEAERIAERALGTVVQLLQDAPAVTLQTLERSGTVTRPVRDRRQAGRRLARAVSRGEAAYPVPSAQP